MLISDKVKIKIYSKNLKYFNNLGFNVKIGEVANIEIKYISKDSHQKVKVKCDICGGEKEIAYREYLRQKNLHNFDTCKKCSQVKNKITNKEKYGVDFITQSDDVKNKMRITKIKKYGNLNNIEKVKKTNLEKYGVEHFGNRKKCFETLIKNGRWTKIEDRAEFYKYYLLVYNHTMKNKKELLDNWNGYDFYTNEYILENFNLNSNDKKYPTIDHKNSIKYGFDNNIPYNEISDIKNLCFTTRSTNSSKNKKTESEYIKKII